MQPFRNATTLMAIVAAALMTNVALATGTLAAADVKKTDVAYGLPQVDACGSSAGGNSAAVARLVENGAWPSTDKPRYILYFTVAPWCHVTGGGPGMQNLVCDVRESAVIPNHIGGYCEDRNGDGKRAYAVIEGRTLTPDAGGVDHVSFRLAIAGLTSDNAETPNDRARFAGYAGVSELLPDAGPAPDHPCPGTPAIVVVCPT